MSKNWFNIKDICYTLKQEGFKTKKDFEVCMSDIYNSIYVLRKKHSKCDWIQKMGNIDIYIEGYFWIRDVYFNASFSLIDADIIFFENLIETYIKICDEKNIYYEIPELIKEDMNIKEFAQYVHRKTGTIKNIFYQLPPAQKEAFYFFNNEKYFSKQMLNNISPKYFKKTYLKYLEEVYLNLRNILKEQGVEIIYE